MFKVPPKNQEPDFAKAGQISRQGGGKGLGGGIIDDEKGTGDRSRHAGILQLVQQEPERWPVVMDGNQKAKMGIPFRVGHSKLRFPRQTITILPMPESGSVPQSGLRLLAGIAVIPLGVLVWAVTVFHVNTIFGDEFSLVPLVDHLFTGQVTFHDFWVQANEHRILFPKLIIGTIAWLTHWNPFCQLLFNVLVVTCTFVILCLGLLAASRETSRPGGPAAILVLSILLFSLNQWENWLWGIQLIEFLNILATVGAIFLLTSRSLSPMRFAVAVILGIVSHYSFGSGILVWPIGFLLLVFGPANGSRGWALGVWMMAAVLSIAGYFVGWAGSPSFPAALDILMSPHRILQFLLIFLGSPLSPGSGSFYTQVPAADQIYALIIGLAGIGLTVFLVRTTGMFGFQPGRRHFLRFGALMAYAGGCGMLAAMARFSRGPAQALASRYISFSVLFWVGLLGFLLLAGPDSERRGNLPAAATVLIGLLALISSCNSLPTYGKHFQCYQPGIAALVSGDPAQDWELRRLYGNNPLFIPEVKRCAAILRRHRLAAFR